MIIIPFMFTWNCCPGCMPTGIWTWAMGCCIGTTVAMVVGWGCGGWLDERGNKFELDVNRR